MPGSVATTGYSLRLLGVASLQSETGAYTGPASQRHRLALLALLAAAWPRGISRDKLTGSLWPERGADPARNLLKQAVHVLRRTLGEDSILSLGDELRFDPSGVACDVIDFEQALAAEDCSRAVSLYAGPFLDGFFLSEAPEFERWMAEERERLRHRYRRALQQLAETVQSRGDTAAAVELWRRLLADDPCSAPVTRRLMQALDLAGDRAAAIRQARLHGILLRQEFDAEPDPKVTALAEALKATGGPAPLSASAGGARPRAGPPAIEPRSGDSRPAPPVSSGSRRFMSLAVLVLLLILTGWVSVNLLASKSPPIRRLGVLPLASLTGDPEQDYFAAGMHDALIAELARIEALTVLSRQSVLRYQGSDRPMPTIARELEADALIEGTVFQTGDSVRITIQVMRARPEEHLLSASYHGPVSRALALQLEVARDIARAVRARLVPEVRARLTRDQPIDPAAQRAYLNGLYHLDRSGQLASPAERAEMIQSGIALLEQATTLTVDWAAGHAQLARAYYLLASTGRGRHEAEFYPKAKAAALRALSLDDTESQAHASLGFVLSRYDWDWVGAERAIRRALELDPNSHNWIAALFSSSAGRYQEAIDYYHRAEERSPLVETLKLQIVGAYECADRHEEAIAQAQELHDRVRASGRTGVPGDSIWLLDFLSRQYGLKGDFVRSIATAETLLARTDTGVAGATLALAYGLAGRRDQARELIDLLEARTLAAGRTWRPAQLYAAIGEFDRALDMVEAAVGGTRGGLATFRCTLSYRLLRDQPRMHDLLRPVGFPD